MLKDDIVLQQLLIDLSESLEHDRVGEQFLPHAQERADDIDAHGDGARAAQDRGGHDGAVLGENERWFSTTATTL